MNDSRLEQIRHRLLQQQQEILGDQQDATDAAATVELDQTRVGRLSRMDALQSQQMALETERRRQLQLSKIEGALRRLESGDYGLCFECGDDIADDRLQADPTCTRCIDCVEE